MQERYFPLVLILVNGEYSETIPFGAGKSTPEEANQQGALISREPFVDAFTGKLMQRRYQHRVQALWVEL